MLVNARYARLCLLLQLCICSVGNACKRAAAGSAMFATWLVGQQRNTAATMPQTIARYEHSPCVMAAADIISLEPQLPVPQCPFATACCLA
jgi:hypothetical protein